MVRNPRIFFSPGIQKQPQRDQGFFGKSRIVQHIHPIHLLFSGSCLAATTALAGTKWQPKALV
jgi:hypothetical protein